jgi:ethanolamine permease
MSELEQIEKQTHTLKRTLGPFMIWGLGVGYVVSGEYFGWNLGLSHGGPLGMLIATLLVTIMYVAFVMSYAEVACALPRAGGVFIYANRAYGTTAGFAAGVSQLIEFLFAPPAIALAIGAYLQAYTSAVPAWGFAVIAYLIFTGLNIWGVRQSALFELAVTVLAVGGLLLFAGTALPHFSLTYFAQDPLPNGWGGIMAALPFAIWFYLAIEGIANVAEETREPQRDISRGFISAMATLVFLALLVFFSAIGVRGWEAIVFDAAGNQSDTPLPLALGYLTGREGIIYHGVVVLGLFGLVASFHGILLIAGRATFEFGRVGYLPAIFGRTLPHRQSPAAALILNMFIAFGALATGQTGELITMAAFGALALYMFSMASLFRLRKTEPDLPRPYVTPFYPYLPAVALVLSTVCFGAMLFANSGIGFTFIAIMIGSVLAFRLFGLHQKTQPR